MAEERLQRRIVAILAADVAGYSRLMSADEEGTLAALTAHRAELIDPKITEFGGRIANTAGDSILAEFPSVIEALRCAIDVQRGIADRNTDTPEDGRIEFRIGLNLGDVIEQNGDLLGEGVNVAARLEGLAHPSGICLSRAARDQVRDRIQIDLEDMGEIAVKNIARPVRMFRYWPHETAAPPSQMHTDTKGGHPAQENAGGIRRWRYHAVAAIALLMVISAATWLLPEWINDPGRSPPDARPSLPVVAVLPFANQTGNVDQDYLADGVTDELISFIGRFHTLRVVGRNSVLPYKGKPASRNSIKSELGANYFVEGSVRGTQKRVRVSVRLVDVDDGTVLWTDRYDGELSDIFQFQDEIARQIAGKLASNITMVESRQSLKRRKPNPGLYDLVLQARAVGFQSTRKANRRFRQLMERAVEMDPDYASTHALLAEAIHARVILGWSEFPDDDLRRGEALARRAIALAPSEPDGHRALGLFLVIKEEHEKALTELRRAIEINPSDVHALAVQGTVKLHSGDITGAIQSLELAQKYNPMLDPVHMLNLAMSYYMGRQHEDAIRIAELGISRFPHIAMFNMPAAAAAARLKDPESVKRYVQQIRQRIPLLNLDLIGSRFKDPSNTAYLKEGLRLAGL